MRNRLLGSNAVRFPAIGALFACLGLENRPIGWLLVWCGVSFILVGVTYALRNPALLGKRSDGSMASWAWLPFGPHLLFTWLSWQAARCFGREPCCNRIADGIWLGRRPYARELPPGIGLVVDLTSEFPVAPGVADGRSYLCFPILDGSVSDRESFAGMVEKIAGWRQGEVYIHCAIGHGRSAMVAAAVLVKKGVHEDADSAIGAIQRVRPKVALNAEQRNLLASSIP